MYKKKPSDRIASLKAFIAEQEDRLANLKTVQLIKAKTGAAREEIEKLEADEAKRKKERDLEAMKVAADQKRKDDQHAKILWGAGLQLLAPEESACVRTKILRRLSDRDQNWLRGYINKNKVTLSVQELALIDPHKEDSSSASPGPIDPAAVAVIRTLQHFDLMALSHIESEFLAHSDGADRNTLEVLFATFGNRLSMKPPNDDFQATP